MEYHELTIDDLKNVLFDLTELKKELKNLKKNKKKHVFLKKSNPSGV
ncbi:hypothetical protein SDC9_96740 [bioreactor metagenome]|uniref:Uncharacterized protein n=1 Tax=bioreactor metagenome TaxID=1076179 RepID=A0A645AAR2_9ZZZZ